MATVKKFNTTYTLDGPGVIVTGNLTVTGAQTALETINSTLKDTIIVLNDGETGAGISPDGTGHSGIEINRGSRPNVQIWYDEIYGQWRLTNDGGTYANILTTTPSGGTALTAVYDDKTPTLGANLNTYGYTISSNVGYVKFDDGVQLNNQGSTPTAVSGTTVIYGATPGAGTSGVYVVNDQAPNQELITKQRSIAFSILL